MQLLILSFMEHFILLIQLVNAGLNQTIKGSIISILTTWVWTGSPYVVPSAMSKSGINAMTQSLAAEWGKV